MRNKGDQANIDNSDLVNYPNGRIVNNTGANNGTPVNEEVYGDLHETKDKLMRLAGIVYNNLPDNETNRYQLVEALKHLPSKNDMRYDLTSSSGVYRIALKLSRLTAGEVFDAIATSDHASESTIASSIGDTTTKTITVVGNFKTGENLKLINLASGIVIIRLVDAVNIDLVVGEFKYLKKATQAQEDAGTSDGVATTPLVSKTTFTKRVNGTLSTQYLASQSRNGLMSQIDKTKLDSIGASVNKYGTVLVGNTGAGTIGQTFTSTGNISGATLAQKFSNSSVIQVNLDTAMASANFEVIISLESLGNIDFDNDNVFAVWKRISNSVIQVHLQKLGSVTQNLKLHLSINQR